LVELINRDSSRTSSKMKKDQSSSNSLKKQEIEASSSYRNDEARLEDIELNIEDPKNANPNNSFDEKDSVNYNLNDNYIKKILKDGET
jgi:hypothetical protein